jgi:hypothetical protein
VTLFGYHSSIVERFPTVVGGVILATGARNGPTPPWPRPSPRSAPRAAVDVARALDDLRSCLDMYAGSHAMTGDLLNAEGPTFRP